MKPRTVRRLCLVDGMNLDHIEGWLESMAARGLHYDHSDAFLFHFRRGEPAAVRYRLEPRGTLDCPEGMEHCRTLGWELTGYMGKGFSLFRTWEPDAPELHTDPVVRGYGLDKLARLVRWFATPMLICALVILALPLWLLLAWDEPVLSLVTGSGDNLFLCILSEWIAIYMSFRSFSSFFALRRRLRAVKEPRRSGWRCSAHINAACLAGSFILVALSFAVLAAGRGMRWEGETATVNRPFPDFALEELEGRPRLEAAPSVWSVERRGVDLDNYVRFDWSVLAPEQYEVERNMADGDYETSFRLDWYRLSLPALAEPFARDLFSRHTFYAEIPERYTVAPLDVPDTDAVLITEEGGFGQDVLLCRGTVVFYLRYYGDQELSAHPELLAELAQFDGR